MFMDTRRMEENKQQAALQHQLHHQHLMSNSEQLLENDGHNLASSSGSSIGFGGVGAGSNEMNETGANPNNQHLQRHNQQQNMNLNQNQDQDDDSSASNNNSNNDNNLHRNHHNNMNNNTNNRKRHQVRLACLPCRKRHAACDETRPCQQCLKHGTQDQCVDMARKKRRASVDMGRVKQTPPAPHRRAFSVDYSSYFASEYGSPQSPLQPQAMAPIGMDMGSLEHHLPADHDDSDMVLLSNHGHYAPQRMSLAPQRAHSSPLLVRHLPVGPYGPAVPSPNHVGTNNVNHPNRFYQGQALPGRWQPPLGPSPTIRMQSADVIYEADEDVDYDMIGGDVEHNPPQQIPPAVPIRRSRFAQSLPTRRGSRQDIPMHYRTNETNAQPTYSSAGVPNMHSPAMHGQDEPDELAPQSNRITVPSFLFNQVIHRNSQMKADLNFMAREIRRLQELLSQEKLHSQRLQQIIVENKLESHVSAANGIQNQQVQLEQELIINGNWPKSTASQVPPNLHSLSPGHDLQQQQQQQQHQQNAAMTSTLVAIANDQIPTLNTPPLCLPNGFISTQNLNSPNAKLADIHHYHEMHDAFANTEMNMITINPTNIIPTDVQPQHHMHQHHQEIYSTHIVPTQQHQNTIGLMQHSVQTMQHTSAIADNSGTNATLLSTNTHTPSVMMNTTHTAVSNTHTQPGEIVFTYEDHGLHQLPILKNESTI